MKSAGSIKTMVILSLIFLLVVFALIFLFALPLFNEIKNYSQGIADKKIELASFEKESVQSKEFEKNQEDLSFDMNRIDSSFTKFEAPIDLIEFWEEMARSCMLSMEISPSSIENSGVFGWKEMGFVLRLKGSFPNTLRFMEKVENGKYLAQVRHFSSVKSLDEIDSEINLTVFAK